MAIQSLGTLQVSLTANLSQFNRGMAQANTQLKSFATHAKGMSKGAGLKGMRTQMAKTSKSWSQGMSSMQGATGVAMGNITAMIAQKGMQMIQQAITTIVDIFKRYESSIVNAAAVSGYLGKSFDTARESIEKLTHELASKTIFTATEVAKAMYTISSAGIDPVTSSAEELIPILQYATATQTSLAEATRYVLTTLKQFRMDLDDTRMVVDLFTSMISNSFMTAEKMSEGLKHVGMIAGELGQDISDVVASLTLLVDRGYEGGQAGMRLNMIFTKLLGPTEKIKKILAGLGLTITDLDPATNSIIDILYKLREANFSTADSAGMFRARSAAAMITMVNSVDSIKEYVDISKELSGITEMIATKQMDTLSGAFKNIQGVIENVSITIGDTLTNAINTAMEAAGRLGEAWDEAFDDTAIGDLGSQLWEAYQWLNPILSIFKSLDYIQKNILDPISEWEDWVEGIKLFNEVSEEGLTVVQENTKAIKEYGDEFQHVIDVKSEMAKYTTLESKNTEEYMQLQLDLINAMSGLDDKSDEVIKTSSKLLEIYMNQNKEVADGIASYNNLRMAQSKLEQLESRRTGLNKDLLESEIRLSKILTTRGADSEEYSRELNTYNGIVRDSKLVNEELITANESVGESQVKYNELLAESDTAVRENILSAKSLIDMRGEVFRAQSDYNEGIVEYNRLLDLQANREKYIADAMVTVYDIEDKLYKLELKRYQLAQNEKSLNDELFNQLGEQGLLTEEIIEEYKEWQQAEGDLAKARAEYAKGEITEKELQKYIKAAAKEQKDYASLSQETAEHYMDIGIASNDVAETLTEIKDLSNDEYQMTSNITSASEDLASALQRVADIRLVDEDDIADIKLLVESFEAAFESAIQNLMDYKPPEIEVKMIIPTNPIWDWVVEADRILNEWAGGLGDWFGGIGDWFGGVGDAFGGWVDSWKWWATGGIAGLAKGISTTKGPQLSMIGEAGAEAVVPLEGSNKKYGAAILKEIIPNYFPEMAYAGGSIVNARSVATPTPSKSLVIQGDINITGVKNAKEMADELMRELEVRSRGRI